MFSKKWACRYDFQVNNFTIHLITGRSACGAWTQEARRNVRLFLGGMFFNSPLPPSDFPWNKDLTDNGWPHVSAKLSRNQCIWSSYCVISRKTRRESMRKT